jgi:hypothetical protein
VHEVKCVEFPTLSPSRTTYQHSAHASTLEISFLVHGKLTDWE